MSNERKDKLYFFYTYDFPINDKIKDILGDDLKKSYSLTEWQTDILPKPNLISHVGAEDSNEDYLRKYYMKNMKIRYWINRFVRNLKTKIAKKRIVGKEDLRTFELIKDDDAIDIVCHTSKSVFRFHVFSLISTFKTSLYYQTWGRPEPQQPKNPFNNLSWSYTQNMEIIKQIQEKLSKKYQALPKFLSAFVECNYDIHTYRINNLLTLAMLAARTMLDEKSIGSDGMICRDETLNDLFDMIEADFESPLIKLIKRMKLPEALQNEWERIIYNSWLYTNYAYSPDFYWKDYDGHYASVHGLFQRSLRYLNRMNATTHSQYTHSLFNHVSSTTGLTTNTPVTNSGSAETDTNDTTETTETTESSEMPVINSPNTNNVFTVPLFTTNPDELSTILQTILSNIHSPPIPTIIPSIQPTTTVQPLQQTLSSSVISHFSNPINLQELFGYTVFNNAGHIRVVIHNNRAIIEENVDDAKEDDEDHAKEDDEEADEDEDDEETEEDKNE
jgi:hypothetical protein